VPLTDMQRDRATRMRRQNWPHGIPEYVKTQPLCTSGYPLCPRPHTFVGELGGGHRGSDSTGPAPRPEVRTLHQRNRPQLGTSTPYIVPFNPLMMYAQPCNHDIQLVSDGAGNVINYVCPYVTKQSTQSRPNVSLHGQLMEALLHRDCSATVASETGASLRHKLLSKVATQQGSKCVVLGSALMVRLLLHKPVVGSHFNKESMYTAPQQHRVIGPVNTVDSQRDRLTVYLCRPLRGSSTVPESGWDGMCHDRFDRRFELRDRSKPEVVVTLKQDVMFSTLPHIQIGESTPGILMYDVNDQQASVKTRIVSGTLWLLGSVRSMSPRTIACVGRIHQRSETAQSRIALIPVPWVEPDLEDPSYCKSLLRRFVPYRSWNQDVLLGGTWLTYRTYHVPFHTAP
jgi:hypothetical protein